MNCSAIGTLVKKLGNVIVGSVQLAFFTFDIDQVAGGVNAAGVERYSSLK